MPRKFYVRGQRHPNTTQVTPSPSWTRKPIVFFFQVTWWPSSWPPASTSSLWHKTALITSRKHIQGSHSRCERTSIEGCWQSGKYGEKELRFLHGETSSQGGRREKTQRLLSKIIKAWNHSGLPHVPSPLHQSKLIRSPPKSTSEGCLVRLHCNRRVDQGHHFFDRYTS